MPVTVVVGGQFGSEGKGKVAHYLAREMHATYAVRCGGSNSGHTVIDDSGNAVIFRHLPTAALLPDVKLVICAGSYIDEDVLLGEISRTNITPERLFISQNAVIITPTCKQSEQESGLVTGIGSTGSGTGAAVVARIKRQSEHVTFAKDCPRLKPFIKNDVTGMLRTALDRQERIILEGTQGFGLSVLHSPYYPYVTSRDTTAAAFVAEAGLSPTDVDDVVLVIRAFPIRVAGDSGPLPNGTTWEEITRDGEHEEKIEECTSVTKKIRRVARFDADIVKRAIYANKPNRVVLNHVDYISKNISDDSVHLMEAVRNFEEKISTRIDFIGLSRKDIRVFHDNANMNFIPPGMLSSPQIRQYIDSGLLVKVPQGTEDPKCFKSATYDMRLGDTSYRYEGNNLKIEKIVGDRAKSDYVTFEPNSLTFVITHEEFNLPKDVIARFNLKGRLVHKGLLLGTGPIIDPEFHGKLLIPIHNFSSSPVNIKYLEHFISVEFTKTLCVSSLPSYVTNKSAKGDPERYLCSMGVVESSVYRKFDEMNKALVEQKELNEQDKRSLEISRTVLIFTWLALFLSTIFFYCYTNSRLDSLFTHFSQQSTGGTKHSEQIESNYNLLWVRPIPGKDNAH